MTEPRPLVSETRRYAVCPDCGHRWSIDHLLEGKFGHTMYPSCDGCGWRFTVTVDPKTDTFTAERCGDDRCRKAIHLLRLKPRREPVYAVVKGLSFKGDNDGHLAYFYKEHTCPTNFLRDIVHLLADGDHDPHGLFEFVGTIADDVGRDPDKWWRENEARVQRALDDYVSRIVDVNARPVLRLPEKGEGA